MDIKYLVVYSNAENNYYIVKVDMDNIHSNRNKCGWNYSDKIERGYHVISRHDDRKSAVDYIETKKSR